MIYDLSHLCWPLLKNENGENVDDSEEADDESSEEENVVAMEEEEEEMDSDLESFVESDPEEQADEEKGMSYCSA